MGSPFLVVQLSDSHVGADWADGDPVAELAAAVQSVRAMRIQPDALLLTGDLADHATDAEYEQVRELLAALAAPAYVLPGNHDDRRALRRHFGLAGADAEPVCYSVDLGPLRLLVPEPRSRAAGLPARWRSCGGDGRRRFVALDGAPQPPEPAGFAVHAVLDGQLVSHIQSVV